MSQSFIPFTISPEDYEGQESADISVIISPPIQLDEKKNYEIALVGGNYINSIPNVSAALGNNEIRYSTDAGSTWNIYTLTTGTFSPLDINTEFQAYMKSQGHSGTDGSGNDVFYIELDISLVFNRVVLKVSGSYEIDFSHGLLYDLLGFQSQVYSAGTYVAPNIAKISELSRILYFSCSLIERGIRTGQRLNIPQVIKVSYPGAFSYPTDLQTVSGNDNYFPLKEKTINTVRMTVRGGTGQTVSFNGEKVFYEFRIREVGSERR